MKHVGIVLYLLLGPVMLVYQIVILADNLKAGFLFPRDIQSLKGDSCAVDNEAEVFPFRGDAESTIFEVLS